MCRFSVSNAAPPAAPSSPGLEDILNDDDFSWFDAIEDIPLEEYTACQADLPAQRDSDCSADVAASDSKPSVSGGFSDTSSYDLVELFKQQVEQDPAMLASAVQAQYGFAPYPQQAQVMPQQQQQQMCMAPAAAGCGMEQVKLPSFSAAAPMNPCMPPPVVAPPQAAAPSAAYRPLAVAPAMQQQQHQLMAPSAASVVRKPGKSQKTQAEVDAAVERIKQKRRESAQRSRARKNEYMRQLELENQSLKDEVHRLQSMLAAMQRTGCMQPGMSPLVGV